MRTEFLYIRRMPIHYVAPPVCDNDFTGTGEPSIVLSTHPRFKVTGLFVQEISGGFRLNWNPVVGGLCYNVYQLIGDEWVLIAECIDDTFYDVPPGVYSVTVITREGESELSDPINTNESVGPAVAMTVVADTPITTAGGCSEPASFKFIRNGPLAGNFFARFQLTGTATYGAMDDYTLTASQTLNMVSPGVWEVLIPDGTTEVFLYVTANDTATVVGGETVVVTLTPTSNYAVQSPDTATVTIQPPGPIAYWKMDGFDAEPIDEVAGLELEFLFNVPGTPNVPGKILEAFNFAANNNQTCFYQTDLVSQFAPNECGIEMLFWIKFNGVIPLGITNQLTIGRFVRTNSEATTLRFLYDVAGNPGFITVTYGTASLSVPFTHTIGDWHFYRVRYDATTGKVGFALDNAALTESVSVDSLNGTPLDGNFFIGALASITQQMDVDIDEVGIFNTTLSQAEADEWWNGGAGKTYP